MGSARPGRDRRPARIVRAPVDLAVEIPPGTAEVRGWVAPERRAFTGCIVRVEIKWGSATATARLVPGEDADWTAVRVASSPSTETTTLHLQLTAEPACPEQVGWVAVSELLLARPRVPFVRPNILVVVLDAVRRDHVDCDQISERSTPTIRGLCDRGVFFENAFSTSSWTYPAVASMLTGHLPDGHRARREEKVGWISPNITTLQEILGWAGYTTAAVVPNPYAGRGLWRGFDLFAELHPPGALRLESRRARAVVDRALEWLQNDPSEPFFLFTLFVDAHTPVDAGLEMGTPPECAGAVPTVGWRGLAGVDVPPGAQSIQRMACRRALYARALQYIDREVARLLGELDARGLMEHTLVFVASDHGEEFWDHLAVESEVPEGRRGIDHGHTHYAEIVHVPLLVVPPGGTPGRRSRSLASVADLFPTALDFAGLSRPERAPARSLRPLVRGRTEPRPRDRVLAENTLYGPARRSVTTQELRAIWTAPDRITVFDRSTDPKEQEPSPPGSPIFRRGVQLLRDLPDRRLPTVSNENDDVRAALEALGYVGPSLETTPQEKNLPRVRNRHRGR
jgi:arylsulfatase A-like enzyme